MKIKIVYTTFDNEKEALLVGEILVKERLAAGVNIHPVKSIFHLRGEIIRREEFAMQIQTEYAICFNVVQRLTELHSQESPCVEVVSAGTTTEFGGWIHQETREAQHILPEN